MIQFLIQHEVWTAIVAYWVVCAAISNMPSPQPQWGPLYAWLYGFLHTIAGNLTTAFGSKIPGVTSNGKVNQ